MKTDVEELSPTRVKLTIEVPFEELKPSLDQAYKKVAQQVRLKGFRPGRVPPRLIDRYFGRGLVIEEAVNDAVPQLYGRALEENEVFALGQPEFSVTKIDDGKELAFTAEVDIRPKFEVDGWEGIEVTVDDAEVTPDEVEEQLGVLRERFATLHGADRPAQAGDYVSIDLSASVDGEELEEVRASGMSYEVGSGSPLAGLDDALVGMSAGDTATFRSELVGGEHAGEQADVTVTVHSVKVKELPELDDEFAQLASEFDTIGELRADIRRRTESLKRLRQVRQARDLALERLLDKIDIPLPDSVVEAEITRRKQTLDQQLSASNLTRERYFEAQNTTAEQFDADVERQARQAVKAGFVLDQLARQQELRVDERELTDYVVDQAMRMGVTPDRLAQHLAQSGQLGMVAVEVMRAKAMDLVADAAQVTDQSGHEIDVKALREELRAESTGEAAAEDGDGDVIEGEAVEEEVTQPTGTPSDGEAERNAG